ncbi:MAG TPA: FmdB family zinc ribbon protein [Vicinamibacterales bacterium]|nr:FmdB family zinc ribbon protein [Vicinamibacterales bacterium]
MPLYEYQCEVCGHRFEVIKKFSDPPVESCQKCGGVVRKLFSSPAIQFKGSGWYITDYARAGKGGDSGDGGSASKDGSESKSGSKTESKSDSAGESKTQSAGESSKSESKSQSKPPPPSTS